MTVVVLCISACSGKTATESGSVVTTLGQSSGGSTSSGAVDDITDVAHPPASGDFVGALVDVTSQSCEQEATGWRVTGIVTNPTTSPVDYRIYVSLLNGSSTTRALVETELLAVGPGADAPFDELVALPDGDLRCVLRVERRAPGS